MCGFCGEVSFAGGASSSELWKMLPALQKRGPDASGLFVQNGIALGHQRLSILDLSATSQQPMVDPQLGLAVVFNGCIYNFRELRDELRAEGYQFFSDGDTEVILKAYAAWGATCVSRFCGMFAFALWERDSGRLVLARDRLGIKPLYLAETKGSLRFASNVQALLAAGGVDTSIDPAALHHYMSWHAVVPPPRTIFNGVRKLPPATVMIVQPDGRREEMIYWHASVGARGEDARLTKEDWRDQVLSTLTRAVERRMIADVPVGVLLSGGLDSSLIVALLANRGQTGLKTFSVGFDAVNGIEGDEFKYSDLIAQRFGTEHVRIQVNEREALAALPGTIAGMSSR